jgi:uncharacterized membrane protein
VEAFAFEWLNLLGRWTHLIVGIAWIGASFYFIWLDNHLLAPASKDAAAAGVSGELWAVHGGGFYHSQKYRVAPAQLPRTLHWFYWEAYSTWLSGFFLLCLLYYARAEIYLIDPQVALLSKPAAIVIGIAVLIGSWLTYDGLCRSVLARHDKALSTAIAALVVALAWLLCHAFSGRGAFIHFGAALGTIMVANVFFVIIPGQRDLVRAKQEGRAPDPIHGIRGKQRSVHNTYFTLPVLFTMISNHYPMTFGAQHNWLVLIAMTVAGAAIRTWFVARHRAHERGGKTSPAPALLGLATLLATIAALAPREGSGLTATTSDFAQVAPIFVRRCQPCHASTPSQPGFATAPAGVLLDTREHILASLSRTQLQLETRAMPIGNLTAMTDEERAIVLAWIRNGAR